jgi:hemerythrin superfamily protein
MSQQFGEKELQMDVNPNAHRGQGGFPVEKPTDALKADHHFVRQLFDQYLNTQDVNVKKDIGPRILLLLEMHTSLEEGVFYPRVHDVDAALVDRCENEHEQARRLMERLKGMDEGDPQADRMFRELADSILKHIDTEEQRLFPKVEQASLDLTAIGHEMEAFEASMIAARGVTADQSTMRQ